MAPKKSATHKDRDVLLGVKRANPPQHRPHCPEEDSNAKKARAPKEDTKDGPSAADIMGSGAEASVEEQGRKAPEPGGRGTNAFITWPHPRLNGSPFKRPGSFSRKVPIKYT